jgi:hypothetical protein
MPKNIKVEVKDSEKKEIEVKTDVSPEKKVKKVKKIAKRPPTLYNQFVSKHWNDEKITGDAKNKMKSIAVLWSEEKAKIEKSKTKKTKKA